MNGLEMELQWVMVVELEKVVPPLEEQLQKEQSRIPRNQQNITKAEVRSQDNVEGTLNYRECSRRASTH